MEYVRLGDSGLKVSRICVGCMSFGDPKLQAYGEGGWVVGREEAFKVMERAWDLGINFFDTANVYSMGKSEEILGEFLRGRRDDAVVATKVFFQMGPGPNDRGLSRKHILRQIEGSLRRLGTSYVDLYQIHRWDYETPVEETLATLTDLVRWGKVLYIGASSMYPWQLAKAYFIALFKGYEKFVSTQTPYNLLYREEEWALIPFCKEHGIAYMVYSPHAAGVLTGRFYRDGRIVIPPDGPARLRDPNFYGYRLYVEPPENAEIVRRVIEVAQGKGVKPAQIALAWLFHKGVDVAIVGTGKVEHMEEAVEALQVKLTSDEIRYLEEPYRPKPYIHALPPPPSSR